MTKCKAIWFSVGMAAMFLVVELVTMFGMGIAYGLWASSQGMGMAELQGIMKSLSFQYIFMMVYYIVMFFAIYFWYRYLLKRDKTYRIHGGFTKKNVLIAIACGVLMQVFTRLVLVVTSAVMPSIFQAYTESVKGYSSSDANLVLTIIVMGILAPVVEELLFRGMIYRILRRSFKVIPAMLICSGIFGLVHLNVIQFIYVFVLSVVLCFVYERTKSLKISMILHAVYNMSSFLLIWIAGENVAANVIIFILSIPAAVGVVFLANMLRNTNEKE